MGQGRQKETIKLVGGPKDGHRRTVKFGKELPSEKVQQIWVWEDEKAKKGHWERHLYKRADGSNYNYERQLP